MHMLLDLPAGVHFRGFVCIRHLRVQLRHVMMLVEACSRTLEFIDIGFRSTREFQLLRDMNFRSNVC